VRKTRRTESATPASFSALAAALAASAALAGPVEVYREGAFCPRDRAAGALPITEEQAIERARLLLPERFCGPTLFVSGCDYLTEWAYDSWRVYAHQYRNRDGRHDWGGLTHTYVILDRVGNCLAHLPGTELGAPR
jgi:hypothetical protein